MNKKSLGNRIMRRGSQSPPLVVTKMLRFVSIEIMFRLMMTSLKTNRAKLATIIMSEGKSMDPYLPKIDELLEKWYPKDKTSSPEKQFEKLELMTGHDLLVITILAHAKVDSKKKIFASNILDPQWKEFVEKEQSEGRPEPNRDEKWPEHDSKSSTTKGDNPKTGKVIKATATIPKRPIRKRRAKRGK
jgi:hypothetical protein